MMAKRLIAVVMAGAIAAVGLFAEGKQEAATGGQGLSVKEVGVQMQPNPLFATMSVALEKGWFQEAGFETVNVQNFTSGNVAGQALIAGQLTAWVPGNVPVISMRHNGMPVVIVGNLSLAYAEMLMVRDDAGVEEPEDLYDIRIGLFEGSTASAVLQALAEDHGLDYNRFNIVNLPPPEQVTAIRNNEIQAILVWPPSPLQVQDIATYRFDSMQYSHTRVPIVFNESFLRNNTDAARAYTEVLYRAQDYVRNNPEESQRIHAERTEQPLDFVKEMWDFYWMGDPPPGHIDQQYVDDHMAYTEFLKQAGRITGETQHILDYTYTGFLEQIKPDYVGVQGRWQP